MHGVNSIDLDKGRLYDIAHIIVYPYISAYGYYLLDQVLLINPTKFDPNFGSYFSF